jgi:tetratricopeptide (TPR) repeat protein
MSVARDPAPRARGHALHIGIAESGKMRALEGDHLDALRHYREALRLAQSAGAPEVFFRHYTQCVLESLERTGAHDEVLDFCRNALSHFEALDAPLALHQRDHAAMLERFALNLIKAGRDTEARAPMEQAVTLAATSDLPVTRTVLDWVRRGMRVDPRRVAQLQDKHGYFSVTRDRVEPKRAIALPDGIGGSKATT